MRSKFEVQSEIMALRQNPGESIASYVRNAEKLSKRVPAELDLVLALCLIKGMTDELKKADISYIVNATPDTSFRKVVDIIKAKYRIIGEPDPFSRVAGNQKSTNTSGWGAYVAPPSGSNLVPVVAAAGRMNTIPTYNVPADRRMGVRPVEVENRANNIYGEKSFKLAAALEGCGISAGQLKGLIDWYLQDSGGNATATQAGTEERFTNTGESRQQDFRQPALPTPGVMNPAHGDRAQTGIPGGQSLAFGQRNATNYGTPGAAPPGVSCFACGRRGHYSMTCPYPPLLPHEQEKLREAARINRLQRAGLPLPVNRQAAAIAVQTYEPVTTIKETTPGTPPVIAGIDNGARSVEPAVVTTMHSTLPLDRGAKISSACAILSRLPPVMAMIQDVMAGKRARVQADSDSEPGGDRGPKAARTRGTFLDADMKDAEYVDREHSEREPTLERVILRPRRAEERPVFSPERNTDISPPAMRAPSSSPAESLTPEATDNRGEDRGQLRNRDRSESLQIPEWLQEVRNRPAAIRPSRPAPINLMKGLDPYNIEAAMVSVKPEIFFPQLLDVSPRLRRELAVLLRSSQPRTRKKKPAPAVQIDKVAGPVKVTVTNMEDTSIQDRVIWTLP